MSRYLFTSESVSEGHPDKVADQISDAILDAFLRKDPDSRVAVETMVTTNKVIISGEVTSKADVEIDKVVRAVIADIGYTVPGIGFAAQDVEIFSYIHAQSPDISQGVTEGEGLFKEQGAGDQGMMFGYACNETPEFMPYPIMAAHKILRYLRNDRKKGANDFLLPDAKSQVTVVYEDGKPVAIDTIVVSTQHSPEISIDLLKTYVTNVCQELFPSEMLTSTKYFVNPTGRFVEGGPAADTGLTGRKIIVDSYGGMGRHGGGAFSGKDPSKVDRSAAYAARYIAKNIVAAGFAEKCEVQLSYAIGVAKPVSIYVNTFGTGVVSDETISLKVSQLFPFTPADIISKFDLKNQIYTLTTNYGHFGKEYLPWERTDGVDKLRGN